MTNLASLHTRALLGLEAPTVTVEVHSSNGLPALSIVGLPETSVKESRDRVRSALMSSRYQLPPQRITLNLAPADLPKSGSRYDLPIALGILLATRQLESQRPVGQFEFFGELSLDGHLRAVEGLLPAILAANRAGRTAIIPQGNLEEAALLDGADVLGANHLLEVCQFLSATEEDAIALSIPPEIATPLLSYEEDLRDIQGQHQAKRALEIAASGRHNLLMVGPPGSGKSMLASRLRTLLPSLTPQHAIEVAAIHSVAGHSVKKEQRFQRPYLAPHHTATQPAMVGGGSQTQPKPGAVSLAHHGTLFLDELPEFSRPVLEALREPLENREIEISRVNGHMRYPANFQLVAALNPSPSGYFPDDPLGRCKDTPEQIAKYLRKISGPLLDRIDLQIEVPPVDLQALQAPIDPNAESSAIVRARVEKCHQRQYERQGCLNAELSAKQLKTEIALTPQMNQLLERAISQMGLSARAYHALLRVTLTIADMQQSTPDLPHLAEAIGYRSLDRLHP